MDVGVLGAFTLPTGTIDKLPLVVPPGRIGWTLTEEGERVEITGSRVDGFARIGKHRIERLGVDFSRRYTAAFVGYDAVDHLAITFDQKSRRVRLKARVGHDEFLQERAAMVASLGEGAADLREAFNRDPDHVRLIVMLSPT